VSRGADVPVSLAPNPVIEAYKKNVDVTLLDENLKLSVPERLLKLREFVDALEEIRSLARSADERQVRETPSRAR
jgi:hypothetical protein